MRWIVHTDKPRLTAGSVFEIVTEDGLFVVREQDFDVWLQPLYAPVQTPPKGAVFGPMTLDEFAALFRRKDWALNDKIQALRDAETGLEAWMERAREAYALPSSTPRRAS